MPHHTVEFGRSAQPATLGGRPDASAFHRNHEPIWSVLEPWLQGQAGDVLELGSGTGRHAAVYARRSPDLNWWPSDVNDAHLRSIAAWRAHVELANLRAPLRIDLADPDWATGLERAGAPAAFRALLCINVLHIAPWRVAEGLFAGAARVLQEDGRLFVYGPFKRQGRHTAPSNEVFDAALRGANPDWGVRDMDDLDALARQVGLRPTHAEPMPANNFVLVFAR